MLMVHPDTNSANNQLLTAITESTSSLLVYNREMVNCFDTLVGVFQERVDTLGGFTYNYIQFI